MNDDKLAPALEQEQAGRAFEAWYAEMYGIDHLFGEAVSERIMLARLKRSTRQGQRYEEKLQPLWESWLRCQDCDLLRSMAVAPRDGTRFLARAITFGFDSKVMNHVPRGEQWVDCWFNDGVFAQWCGNEHTSSSGGLTPVGWIPLPGTPNKTDPLEHAHG